MASPESSRNVEPDGDGVKKSGSTPCSPKKGISISHFYGYS